jgi:hypothetical protein
MRAGFELPSTLWKDSFEELEGHFQLFLRRARRRALGQRLVEGLTKDDEAANEGAYWFVTAVVI